MKGSFIPAPPAPGELDRKGRKRCNRTLWTQLYIVFPCDPLVSIAFSPASAPGQLPEWNIWRLLFKPITAYQGMEVTALVPHNLTHLKCLLPCISFHLSERENKGKERRIENKLSLWKNKRGSLGLEGDIANPSKTSRHWQSIEATQRTSHIDTEEQTGAKAIKKKKKLTQNFREAQFSSGWLQLPPKH
jgi:hypothetical protein